MDKNTCTKDIVTIESMVEMTLRLLYKSTKSDK